MSVSDTISRKEAPLPSLNYNLLRLAALERIQQLAGLSWTDHNGHDPGITILEVLAYAITDLGNRLNLPIEDLIYSQPDFDLVEVKKLLLCPEEILPNCAATERDFRKVLLDVAGIRNVYLVKADQTEQTVFYDEATEKIVYDSNDNLISIDINGLYSIQCEFDDPKLNTNILRSATFTIDADGESLTIIPFFSFPYWDELGIEWFEPNIDIIGVEIENQEIIILGDSDFKIFAAKLFVEFNNGIFVELDTRISLSIDDSENVYANLTDQQKEDIVNNQIIPLLEFLLYNLNPEGLVKTLLNNVNEINQIIRKVRLVFHENRNLCEDLYQFKVIRAQEIKVAAKIYVLPGTDVSQLQAKIFFAIEQFFSPQVRYHSLQTLLEEGHSLADIYEGPPPNTEKGFILEEELIGLKGRDTVYTSDLINLIMSLEGVFAVSDMLLCSFINNEPIIIDEQNCLKILASDNFRPILSIEKSNLNFCKRGETTPINVDATSFNNQLTELRAEINQNLPGIEEGCAIPEGDQLPIEDYYSIQHHFPLTYGIGVEGLPLSSSPERKAQAKQLKAYLSIFDQILANNFAQLANLGNLFSLESSLNQTYYYQDIYEIPDIQELLNGFDSQVSTWEEFKADNLNGYLQTLRGATEQEATFLDRKNRLLDHLLARFAEDFSTYGSTLQSMLNEQYAPLLIHNKLQFLNNYVSVSGNRLKAYNHKGWICDPNGDIEDAIEIGIWDSDNISGFEKRICKLTGLSICNRSHINTALFDEDRLEFYSEGFNQTKFRLKNDQGNILLVSLFSFDDEEIAYGEFQKVLQFGLSRSYYSILPINNGNTYRFVLRDGNGTTLAQKFGPFLTVEEAEAAIQIVIKELMSMHGEGGIHLLEHILLRPKIKGTFPIHQDFLLQLPEPLQQEIKDPYSFVMTVVLPSGYKYENGDKKIIRGLDKFRNEDFRAFLKKTILEEAPAHIYVLIYTLSKGEIPIEGLSIPISLDSFEQQYKNWLEKNAAVDIQNYDQVWDHLLPDLSNANQPILDLLQAQRSFVKTLNLMFTYNS